MYHHPTLIFITFISSNLWKFCWSGSWSKHYHSNSTSFLIWPFSGKNYIGLIAQVVWKNLTLGNDRVSEYWILTTCAIFRQCAGNISKQYLFLQKQILHMWRCEMKYRNGAIIWRQELRIQTNVNFGQKFGVTKPTKVPPH